MGLALKSAFYVALVFVLMYFYLRGDPARKSTLRLKVGATSGVFLVGSFVGLFVAETSSGRAAGVGMAVFWTALGISTVLLLAAMLTPGGI